MYSRKRQARHPSFMAREVVSIGKYRPFDGLQCHYLQDKAVSESFLGLLCPEGKRTMNLHNYGNLFTNRHSLTLILPRSRTGTVWFYTSTSNKRAARPKLYTESLTRDLKLMYGRFTLVRISIKL